ncbi:MAG: DedA family protein [Candidatus Dadabacteria bacterium]|nr:DedA family protein [Candidatus Dadabacteria bacterium]NIY22501.1 DedA family protein [Candidatus Dadabacteria bacterium]
MAFVSFIESSFFPVPPDPLLLALGLGKPGKAIIYAIICSVASIAGGVLGYLIGLTIWESVSGFFFTYLFSLETFNYVGTKYNENAFLAILGAAFTPIPYKVFTISAGVFKINLAIFILASAIGRSARFLIEGILIYLYGESIRYFIEKYLKWLSLIFFILLVAGIYIIKFVLH